MSGTQFAMVSRWMPNGNINEFLEVRRDANRFELVSAQLMFLPRPFLAHDRAILAAGRRRGGLGVYARTGDGPR